MTSSKRKHKTYTQQFKEETVALVTDQGYSVIEAAEAVGVRPNQIYNWKQRIVDEATGARLTGEDREELLRLGSKGATQRKNHVKSIVQC